MSDAIVMPLVGFDVTPTSPTMREATVTKKKENTTTHTAAVARMALVTHLLPAAARFHETNVDLIYSRYKRQGDLSLDESFFPVLWDETGYRTPWLASLPDID